MLEFDPEPCIEDLFFDLMFRKLVISSQNERHLEAKQPLRPPFFIHNFYLMSFKNVLYFNCEI
jgi:hypothetical protein